MPNPTVELGTFLLFALVPFLSILVMRWLRDWGWPGRVIAGFIGLFGFIMLAAMALFMFSEYDVVVTKVYAAQNITDINYNASGDYVGNTTRQIPEQTETNPIINSNHYEFGWLFFVMALLFGLVSVKVVFQG